MADTARQLRATRESAPDVRSERIAKHFDTPLLLAAVITIPVTILELLTVPEPLRTVAEVLNWLIWVVFLTELVVMLVVVPSKRDWLRRHLVDLAIVALTPPFLASVVQSARVLRLLRRCGFYGSLRSFGSSSLARGSVTRPCSRSLRPLPAALLLRPRSTPRSAMASTGQSRR